MVGDKGYNTQDEAKGKIGGALIFILICVVGVIIIGITNEVEGSDVPDMTLINVDKQEGLVLLGEITTLDYNEMIEKYGKPSRLYDLTSTSGRYWCEWDKIKIKKEGIPVWCNLKTAYKSRTNVYSASDTYKCK